MKSTFIVDILSVMPYQLIDFIVNKSVWYCIILNLVKIIRIRSIIVYSRRLCSVSILKLLKQFLYNRICFLIEIFLDISY